MIKPTKNSVYHRTCEIQMYFDLLTSDEQNVLDVGFVNDEMVRIHKGKQR